MILFRGSGQYAIAVVVHDKNDHSNALVALDFLSKEEYRKYNHTDRFSLVKPDRLPSEPVTQSVVDKSLASVQNQISTGKILGVLRSYESPNTEKVIVIFEGA